MKPEFIVMLIQTVIFFLPVATLIYSQGKKDQRLSDLEKDVNTLGTKVSGVSDHHKHTIDELHAKIAMMDKELGKISTSIDYIKVHIQEMKK